MSTDPSKITYCCITCRHLPCICKKEHKPLDILKLKCWSCPIEFLTLTELQNHHLDFHEKIHLKSALDVADIRIKYQQIDTITLEEDSSHASPQLLPTTDSRNSTGKIHKAKKLSRARVSKKDL